MPFEPETLREGGVEHIRKMIRETDPKTPSIRLSSLGDEAREIAEGRRTEIGTLAKNLRKELEWIPLKAMRKERSERYRSASELADEIENYLKGIPLLAGPPGGMYRIKKFVRRNRALVAGIAAILVVLLGGIIVSAFFAVGQAHARAEAQTVSDLLLKTIVNSLNLRNVGSKEITVRSVLKTISDDVETEFRDLPLLEATIRQKLASAYGVLGLYAPAELHAERAFEICRTRLEPENMTTVHSWFQVGWIHLLRSRYSDAEPLLAKALPRFKLAFGEGDYRTLWCVAFLGWVYNFQGRFPKAEELFKEGLDAAQRTQGAKHPVAPFLMYSWAFAHQIQGRHQEAEGLYLRGLEICGEWHDEELFLKRGLGALYWEMGRYDEAEERLRAAVEGRSEVWGEEHHETPRAMADLGWLYHSKGKYEEAEELLDKAMKIAQQTMGDPHTTTAHCMHGLGALYLSQGRHDEAELLLEKVLDIQDSQFGEDNWQVMRVMNTLARLYTAQGRSDDAESLFKETLEGRVSKLGEDHPDTLETKNDLAVLYKGQAKHPEAEQLLLDAVEGRRVKLGAPHPHTQESIKSLIELYEAWGKPEKAQQWHAELHTAEATEKRSQTDGKYSLSY
jgi:tetratricopeptide (TPR) repeat protein